MMTLMTPTLIPVLAVYTAVGVESRVYTYIHTYTHTLSCTYSTHTHIYTHARTHTHTIFCEASDCLTWLPDLHSATLYPVLFRYIGSQNMGIPDRTNLQDPHRSRYNSNYASRIHTIPSVVSANSNGVDIFNARYTTRCSGQLVVLILVKWDL